MDSQSCMKETVISSLIWKFLERLGTQGIQFVVSIILARLLLPSDYGVVTMIMVFTAISNAFIQAGFSTSLIQQKNSDELDYSSVFYTSFIIATLCYVILYIAAPIIADFYNMQQIKDILRVISLTLFFGALNSVQIAKLSKDMKFKNLFFCCLCKIISSLSTLSLGSNSEYTLSIPTCLAM